MFLHLQRLVHRCHSAKEDMQPSVGGSKLRAIYSLREFSPFVLVSVYIPPHACVMEALQQLADQESADYFLGFLTEKISKMLKKTDSM